MSDETPDLAAALEESIAAFHERYRHPKYPEPVHGWVIRETDPVLDGPVVVFKHSDYGRHTLGGKTAEGIMALIADATLLTEARKLAAAVNAIPVSGTVNGPTRSVDALKEWLSNVRDLLALLTEEATNG